MNTQEQAYIEGFVKRASQYGFNYNEAISLLKQADEYVASEPTFAQKAAIKPKPIAPAKPMPTRPVPPKPKVPNYPGEADANDVAGYR